MRPFRRALPSSGFTLLELIIVLVVLTAVASIGIPQYFGRASITLDSAAELLARDLREVQSRAALFEETLHVHFDVNGTSYLMADDADVVLLSPYGNGEYARDYDIDAVFRGVSIVEIEPRSIAFDKKGTPNSDLRVVLEYGHERCTLTLSKESSRITIEGLSEPWVDDIF